MNAFETEIKKFLVDGIFENNIDDVGNVNLNTDPININERYISFSLINTVYDNNKIKELYDVDITEFSIPTNPTSVATINEIDINQLTTENENLKLQLDAIISSNNEINTGALDAAKEIIIKLRIKLGEGVSESDFSDAFPYLKK